MWASQSAEMFGSFGPAASPEVSHDSERKNAEVAPVWWGSLRTRHLLGAGGTWTLVVLCDRRCRGQADVSLATMTPLSIHTCSRLISPSLNFDRHKGCGT